MAVVNEGVTAWTGFNGSNKTTHGVTIPAGAQIGELLVCTVTTVSTTFPVTFSGDRSFAQAVASAGGRNQGILYKICASGDPGATMTITSSNTTGSYDGYWVRYSGVDTTDPLANTTSVNSGTCNTTTLTVNAVTMDNANSLLFALYYINSASATFTTGTMTELADANPINNLYSFGLAEEAVAASGSTGTRAITSSVSTNPWDAIAIGINEAAGAAAQPIMSVGSIGIRGAA